MDARYDDLFQASVKGKTIYKQGVVMGPVDVKLPDGIEPVSSKLEILCSLLLYPFILFGLIATPYIISAMQLYSERSAHQVQSH
jgi:hypothetical protein